MRALEHRLVKRTPAAGPAPSPLGNPLLDVFPVLRKLIIEHFLGLIPLDLGVLDLLLLIDFGLWLLLLLFSFLHFAFEAQLSVFLFSELVPLSIDLLHGLLLPS